MSDDEDEMDMDASPVRENNTITFGAEAKGKRSAANLPVEAEDTLPWSELYPRDRPHQLQSHAKGKRRTGWRSIDRAHWMTLLDMERS